jgi:uncharacterized membrane protein
MILMVLDHSRFFMHNSTCNPENLQCTSPPLFLTRWITHFCAPVFIFLVGTSAYLYQQSRGSSAATKFLVTRGLFLIVLELTLFRFAWNSDFFRPSLELIVIWAIGISMLFLAMAKYLNFKLILVLGLLLVFCHNLFDSIQFNPNTIGGKIWTLLHEHEAFDLSSIKMKVLVVYPVLPYFGIAILGYCFGKLYSNDFSISLRKKYLLILGLSITALFLVLRLMNSYGDPLPWSTQSNSVFTFLSFLKTTKYPVSLMYILMTIGPGILLLYLFEKWRFNFLFPVVEIGQVPMFFYLLHLFVIKIYAISFGGFNTYNLEGVYLGWLISTLFLYVLCKYYRIYKFSHPEKKWLRYI